MENAPKPKWPYPKIQNFPGTWERFGYRSYNYLENRLWPIRPLPFLGIITIFTGFQLKSIDFNSKFPISMLIRPILISIGSAYTGIFILRHFLKYFYFAYKGYLKEDPKEPSMSTKLWGLLRKVLLRVAPPQLSSCDGLLPNLPLPKLENSVKGYVESMRWCLEEKEHLLLTIKSTQFLETTGPKLQKIAWIYQKFQENYVTPFWEKYIYYGGRYPLPINSSIAQLVQIGEQDRTQAYQVARLIWIETLGNLSLDRQNYHAVGDGLMSTRHYRNIYNGARIPEKEHDYFQWNAPSSHVAVVHKGTWYKVETCDRNGKLYGIEELTKIISELINRNDKTTNFLSRIASLTADRRTEWAQNRQRFFTENRKNSQFLKTIETAQFVVAIEGDLEWGTGSSASLSRYMKGMMVGDGTNRWFDKTMNYAVAENGRSGAAGEHSPCDGAEADHLCENFLVIDRQLLATPTRQQQLEMEILSENDQKSLRFAEKLEFEELPEMEQEIERCYQYHISAINDFHVHSEVFTDFGKGRIKKCGISPDGFVQMAIQLAFYKDQGKFTMTYETGSVRFFANSRTETLRPVTEASCKFVMEMMNENSSRSTRRALLQLACQLHVSNCKDIMMGKGFDRHLFILAVLAKGFGYSSDFLDFYAAQKWLLSTSNIPNMTNTVDEDSSLDNVALGGAFGAVAQNGYGICYRFGGNIAIPFHVTSYHSSESTDSDRMARFLVESFEEMAALFD